MGFTFKWRPNYNTPRDIVKLINDSQANLLSPTGKPVITYDKKLDEPKQLKGGSTLILSANFTGTPTPHVTWTGGECVLNANDVTSLEITDKSTTLTIKNVTAAHSQTYTLTAENEAGSDTANFSVNVKGRKIYLFICFFISY